uniref:GTPase domain-containing protein n=1 Tax=Janibacter limosus TaxID=53458 RepID=A0AC61U1J9_9MICO|nr:GTPase domain-containing protein [Janibacter limosus]
MGEIARDSGVDADLPARISALRDEVDRSRLTLDLPSTQQAWVERQALLDQLDDYVIPRLSSIDAPLLAVVGGSTGSGKSTLVNSILRREVSRSGVLRPTTTSPVLIHHPDDERWFRDARILPSLGRVTGDDRGEPQPGTVRPAPSPTLPPGMAILDAPRHRLRRLGQPRAGGPAPLGRRPVALRHHCGAVRRRDPVEPAASGRRPGDRRRARARPRRPPGHGRGPHPPDRDAA